MIDGKKVIKVEGSQDFLSNQYDAVVKENTEIKENIDKLSKKIEQNMQKTERNAGYSRFDCLELGGVPVHKDSDGKENCKHMVINICKELNLSLREDSISTAHRLKQHPDKKGPPTIIVKFSLRDVRNDVYALRKTLKQKETKINIYGINTLYINESLTPEKRKLLYETKKFQRSLSRDFGRIYVWTFKGDIYMRQDIANVSALKISSVSDFRDFERSCRILNSISPQPSSAH